MGPEGPHGAGGTRQRRRGAEADGVSGGTAAEQDGRADAPRPRRRDVRRLLADGKRMLGAARRLLSDEERARGEVRDVIAQRQAELVQDHLDALPLSRLKDAAGGRLRLGALEQAGYTTVGSIHRATAGELRDVPGVGGQTAEQVTAAAAQLAEAERDSVAVPLDAERRDPVSTRLVTALHRLVAAGPDLPAVREAAARAEQRLAPPLEEAGRARGWLRMAFAGSSRREQARHAVADLREGFAEHGGQAAELRFTQTSAGLLRPPPAGPEAWTDYEARAAEYHTMLAEVAESREEDPEGRLPESVAEGVRGQDLDESGLRVSLRGYQAFGARFALAQRRAILGDEMGLGKTVQSIAAMAHLAARGHRHCLVVCPASVLVNWLREIEGRSTLRAFRVHGPDRERQLAAWERSSGGVAVTTVDSLHRLTPPESARVAMLVVDEAHYVKNPQARRSRAVALWSGRARRTLFLTGTPMENRVEEFRNLVAFLRPEVADRLLDGFSPLGADTFRREVAPVYLRRNQSDVLTELPGLVETDDWVEFGKEDFSAYRDAVADGRFMAMRRAAYAVPGKSAKLRRLAELVEEAEQSGRKVVVFSFFHEVMAAVQEVIGCGSPVFGPITGGVPAARRQEIVDGFAKTTGHAVLLSQIQAGGTGLNMQAASTVILCEPQVKPTLESQAIARVHRMGQVRRVQVHRLLATDSVDQRMLDILGGKAGLFDAYARRSHSAESTPGAVDVSEPSLARRIVEAEQQRLAGGRRAAPV